MVVLLNIMGKRVLYIDILKLFTIFLVLWGHAIMHFQPDYEQSVIFQVIYAFHMPLFMMLSGYFAQSSMTLDFKTFFPKKIRQLLLPCLSWGIICWLFITSGLIEGRFHLEWKGLFTGWLGLIDNFWFLKSCFICYTLSWLCWQCGKYKLYAMGTVWMLCTLQGRFHLAMMFPSFLLGMALRHNASIEEKLTQYRYWGYIIFLTLFIIGVVFPFVRIYPFKLALGALGAITCFMFFKMTIGKYKPTPMLEKLAEMGGATLGIYVIQAILLEVIMPHYVSFKDMPMSIIVVLMLVISLVMLTICVVIINLLNRSNLLGFLMFGREYRK